jgi:ribosomal protein L20A (L18A)
MSHGEEFEEASEQSRRSFPKTLFALSRCRITEDDGSRDLLSRSQMHIDERDEVALAA